MQKLISFELYARRIPKDPGFEFRDDYSRIQKELDAGWRISHVSSSYVNQNVYIISLVLNENTTPLATQQKLVSLELYAERIPKQPGYLYRAFDPSVEPAPEGEGAQEEIPGELPPAWTPVQQALKDGWEISMMSMAYINENIYVITLVLELKN